MADVWAAQWDHPLRHGGLRQVPNMVMVVMMTMTLTKTKLIIVLIMIVIVLCSFYIFLLYNIIYMILNYYIVLRLIIEMTAIV